MKFLPSSSELARFAGSRGRRRLRLKPSRSPGANSPGANSPGANSPGANSPGAKGRGPRRRRLWAAAGGLALCGFAPSGVFQVLLYKRNLAMANTALPPAPIFSSRDRLLILSPHCDDETLGAGGSIAAARAAGAQVRVVFLTNGDGSRSTQIVEDARQLRRNSFVQLARLRQREAVAAMSELGVGARDVVFLGYPDGGTQAMWESHWTPDQAVRSAYTGFDHSPYDNSRTRGALYCGAAALRDVRQEIENWRPTFVITTHPADTHPDHWAAYAYAATALEQLRLKSDAPAWVRRVQLLTFLVHHGIWPAPHGYHPDAPLAPPADLADVGTRWLHQPLDNAARTAKKAALERYVSQLPFTPQFLRGFLRRNELFGALPVLRTPSSSLVAASWPGESSPAESSPGESSQEQLHDKAAPVLQDPTRDSLLHDVWPAADLQSVGLTAPPRASTLTLRLRLATAPSRRLRYQFALHTLTAGAMQAWNIRVQADGSAWKAVLRETSGPNSSARAAGRRLEVQQDGDALQIAMPRASLGLSHAAATLLISASTHLGASRLDQTETGTARLGSLKD